MRKFDDSHYRLGRVSNTDAKSNKARIDFLENSINELNNLISSGKYNDEEMSSMICELNTMKSQLKNQLCIKEELDTKPSNGEDIKGLFINDHNDYDDVMFKHLSSILDSNFTGFLPKETTLKKINTIVKNLQEDDKSNEDRFIERVLSNGVTIKIGMNHTTREVNEIYTACDTIAKDKQVPVNAFKFGYDGYLKISEGSNPIPKDNVKIQDFTMISISHKILSNGKIELRPVYKFNIPVNGKTAYLTFIISNKLAYNINWLTSLSRKKAKPYESINLNN